MDRSRKHQSARGVRTVAMAAVLALALGACEYVVGSNVNTLRSAEGRPALPVSTVLSDTARAHSTAMCSAGAVTPSPNAGEEYDPESHGGVYELVGSAPLPTEVAPGSANLTATNEIWAGWQADPQLTAARWDDMGVGEVVCGDGRLYMTTVLRDSPSMPASGLYSSAQYTPAQLQEIGGLQYGQAINEQGQNQALLLDLYLPPGTTPAARPTVVLIHGGGFTGGTRADMRDAARTYAQRGYVAASISYRLGTPSSIAGAGLLTVAGRAIDDAMESVRWLKANATTYRIDSGRVAAVGFSAGGAIALGVAVASDPTPGGPLAAFTPAVAAAVSTGAHITPGIGTGLVGFEATDAPVLMFHYGTDSATGDSSAYAFETCTAVRASGNTCDFVTQPGSGHTTNLSGGGTWWTPELGPFLWEHLGLAG